MFTCTFTFKVAFIRYTYTAKYSFSFVLNNVYLYIYIKNRIYTYAVKPVSKSVREIESFGIFACICAIE